jgi:hypothetical protein
MEAHQREMRQFMIEGNLFPPTVFIVASLAVGAELAFMRVMLFVAGNTSCGELVLFDVGRVAGFAFGLSMCSTTGKFRLLIVIKTDHVPFR